MALDSSVSPYCWILMKVAPCKTQINQDLEDRKSIMGFPALQTAAAPVFLWSPPHGNLCLSISFWWKTHSRDMQRIACGSVSLKCHDVSETAITAVICDLQYLPADVQMKCKSRYWFMVLKPFTELPLSLCWVSPAGIQARGCWSMGTFKEEWTWEFDYYVLPCGLVCFGLLFS